MPPADRGSPTRTSDESTDERSRQMATEERLLDLLQKSLERQEKAISKMDSNLCARLDTLDGSVKDLAEEVGAFRLIPDLLKIVALALALVGGAMGLKLGVDVWGQKVTVDSMESAPVAAPPEP